MFIVCYINSNSLHSFLGAVVLKLMFIILRGCNAAFVQIHMLCVNTVGSRLCPLCSCVQYITRCFVTSAYDVRGRRAGTKCVMSSDGLSVWRIIPRLQLEHCFHLNKAV